jgi:hypothetical protein
MFGGREYLRQLCLMGEKKPVAFSSPLFALATYLEAIFIYAAAVTAA